MAEMIPVLPIAALSDGEMMRVSAHGVDLLVCQVAGQIYALADRCSHARQALSNGKLSGFEVRCPLHGARFDVRTGACKSPPATFPVKTFPVTLEGGKVCVSVSADDKPAPPRFGPM